MSFIFDALADRPLGIFAMDGSSPVIDYSGQGVSASISGPAPDLHPPLIRGQQNSQILTGSTTALFNTPVFNRGRESDFFTLEAWVRATGPSSEQQILGNAGAMDGLTINGNIVSFVTKYENTGEARVTHDLQQGRAIHIVGVHTAERNTLYIDGQVVGESPITKEQQEDFYELSSTGISSGETSGSQGIAISGVAIYVQALSPESIARHFSVGRSVPRMEEVANANAGSFIPLSIDTAPVFLDQWWSTEEDWKDATLENVSVLNDRLVPQMADEVSLTGQWIDNFVLGATDATSIYGVVPNWDGEGATVEASIDGSTWEVLSRGRKISSIPEGFNPKDKSMLVRVSFPGGIPNDPSYIDNLNMVGILSSPGTTGAGRIVSYDNSSPEREYVPLALHDNWGAGINDGGTVTISVDPNSDAPPVRTIELWIKRVGTAPSISMSGTTYINGQSSSTDIPDGRWSLIHIVSASNITGDIIISGPCQVGGANLYDYAFTASDVLRNYRMYSVSDILKVTDNSTVQVLKSQQRVSIYAHDWSIISSG